MALAFAAPVAFSQPTGATVIHGGATFSQTGSNLTVTTTNGVGTSHSAINWTSFSVPANSTTQFVQPSAASTSINRVVAANPSQILGTLSSNGKLVLVNPSGITVGAGATVDTAGFVASTLAMSDADALAGRLHFAGGTEKLQVDGTIRAQGGDIVLIAPQIGTGASSLVQSDGSVVLAAGQDVLITGRGLEGITMQVQAGTETVNLGTLQGDAVGIFAGTLRHSGFVQAQSVDVRGGKVVLKAADDALVDGTITARAGDRGGGVDVLGTRVGLLAGASVDASGARGGGNVRIGGDYRGGNSDVPNAQATYVDARATIAADATQQGDGGRVIVWADDTTRMRGYVSARGGPQGGDGGFAEVSGRKDLVFTGRVDLRAAAGKTGTLLLDPNDIVISGSHVTDTYDHGEGIFSGGGDTAYVAASDLSAELALSNVHVTTGNGSSSTATGHLTLASDATVHWSSGHALTLEADNGVTLAGQVIASGDGAPGGTLHLYAHNGDIQQTGGSLTVGGLLVWAEAGDVALEQPNQVGVLAGHSGDGNMPFRFHNAGTLTIGRVSAPAGSSNGINESSSYAGETAVSTAAGAVVVRAPVAGSSVSLLAAANVELQEGAEVYARDGKLVIGAGADVAIATEEGEYGVYLSAAKGLEITAGGSVRTSSVWPGDGAQRYAWVDLYGSAAPGSTGVAITAHGGDVDFGPDTYIGSWRSPVTVTSDHGSILGSVNIWTYGSNTGTSGDVTLTASNGSVQFGGVNSSGSYSAPAGGKITITAKGDVQGQWLRADGIDGGKAGEVQVETSGSVLVGEISATGGDAWSPGGTGGDGGKVKLTFGGTVQVRAIDASGGNGGDGNGDGTVVDGIATLPNGGNGGAGGRIELTRVGSGTWMPEGLALAAPGGAGGSGYMDELGTAKGGTGGAGGHITVHADGGALALRTNQESPVYYVLAATAGAGGVNGDDATYAASGAAGQVNLLASTDLAVDSVALRGTKVGFSAQAGGLLEINMPIVTESAPVTLQGSSITLANPIDTTWSDSYRYAGAPRAISRAAVTTSATTGTGADIVIAADTLNLQSPANAGSAHVIVHPLTSTRATRLGGLDDGSTLYLSQGEIDLMTAGTLVFGDPLNSGGVTVGGPITIDPVLATSLSLVSQGAIAQDLRAPLAAQNLNVAGGSVILADVTTSTLSGRANAGRFQVLNQGSSPLTIGSVDATSGIVSVGPVTVTTPGTLVLDSAINTEGAVNSAVLVASHLQVGPGGSIATPLGRWLVYLDTPDGNDFGTLRSGNYALWGHTAGANPALTITESGNRYLFATLPVVDVQAGAATKVYDGTTNFTLPFQATSSVNAAQYQNAFLQDDAAALTGALAIANPGKDVGSYAITQGTLAGGYTIHFTGNTATIKPAPLTIQANNLNKEEGTTLVFSGTEFTPAKTGIGDETITSVSLASEGAAAAAKPGAYAITASNASGTNGFAAGNYAITYLDGALAVSPAARTESLHMNNQVVTFASLFVDEARLQVSEQTSAQDYKDAKKKRDEGRDDLVVTDTSCK